MKKKEQVYYKYVGLDNEWMRQAYDIAKELYNHKKWNLKTTPVAVIVDINGKFVSQGASANGKHALLGHCDRLGKAGTDYSKCKHCAHDQHAELYALKNANKTKLTGATIYLYGHYKMCDNCIKVLSREGIYKCVLLKDCEKLFDRHNVNTILGTNRQFVV